MKTDLLLVTSWGVPCGIAEHSAMLLDAIHANDPGFEIGIAAAGHAPASPETVLAAVKDVGIPLVHLNYHAALHSQYTPERVVELQKAGAKVVITYHDTGIPNSDQCKALHRAADAFIIHEPAEDLPGACYWRMGVEDWAGAFSFNRGLRHRPQENSGTFDPWPGARPILGSIGFPFGWKNYDKLIEVAAAQGWAVLLLAPTATPEQIGAWREITPYLCVVSDFTSGQEARSLLAGCDATAFLYVCHNTGQSGAILQGIAARKPVIALKTCRQFRALYEDPLGRATIRWADTFDDVAAYLRNTRIQRVDPAMVALAEQEAWTKVGKKHVDLYRSLR